jgi:hypothetical protein
MLRSCKLRLRRASPTVGLPSAHRVLLGLRRLYAGGAKTDSYRCRVAGLFFSAARRQKRRKGWGGSPNSCSVAASYASAGASPTVGLPSSPKALLCLRRASPTVGLPSSHRVLLGLRRLYAGGAKTDSYRCRVAGLFFSAARRQKRRKGLGGSPNSCSVAPSYASAGQARMSQG